MGCHDLSAHPQMLCNLVVSTECWQQIIRYLVELEIDSRSSEITPWSTKCRILSVWGGGGSRERCLGRIGASDLLEGEGMAGMVWVARYTTPPRFIIHPLRRSTRILAI